MRAVQDDCALALTVLHDAGAAVQTGVTAGNAPPTADSTSASSAKDESNFIISIITTFYKTRRKVEAEVEDWTGIRSLAKLRGVMCILMLNRF